MAQVQMKTIKEAKSEVRANLHALTRNELGNIPFDVESNLYQNVGIIGVEGTNYQNYVLIKKDTLQEEQCFRHNTNMKNKMVMKNGVFKESSIYYQCDVVIGPILPSGCFQKCHDNLFPMYPLQQLQQELLNPNVTLRPTIMEVDYIEGISSSSIRSTLERLFIS